MRETLKDELVTVPEGKFHYVDTWYENHSTMSESEGTVSISQVDENGKENGLYVCNHYYHTNQPCDENGYTEVGAKKDGQLDGALYGYRDGNLVQVKLADKVIGPENVAFSAYKKTAPKFKESFKLLNDAKSSLNQEKSANFIERLKQKGRDLFK